MIWDPLTDIELIQLQEEKQTDEDREYETSDSSASLSNGEESDEDRVSSRKSNSKAHVFCKPDFYPLRHQ